VIWMMYTDGDQNHQDYSPLNWLTETFLLDPLPLDLGRSFGNLVRPENAKPLCGWQLGIVVGRLIVCKKGDCLTRSVVLFVTRRNKRPNTFSLLVYLQGSFGVLFYSLLTW